MRSKALAGCLLLCAFAIGCGDDENSSDGGAGEAGGGTGGAGGTGGTGGRNMLPDTGGTGGSAGDAAVGDGEEGFPCLMDTDCGETPEGVQLKCVESGFNFGVCARGCASDDDCGSEVCDIAANGATEDDLHCIDLVNEEFATCGVAETSNCAPSAGLTCLYLPDLPLGVCTKLCTSSTDDAGVPDPVCDEDQFCRGNIVASSGGTGPDGVCGARAGRGEPCGIFLGAFCAIGDVCAPEDPADEDSEFVCRQNCTESPDDCAEGTTCTQFQGVFFCQ